MLNCPLSYTVRAYVPDDDDDLSFFLMLPALLLASCERRVKYATVKRESVQHSAELDVLPYLPGEDVFRNGHLLTKCHVSRRLLS